MSQPLVRVIQFQEKLAYHHDDSHSAVIIGKTVLCAGLTSTTLKTSAPHQFILETKMKNMLIIVRGARILHSIQNISIHTKSTVLCHYFVLLSLP